ncbi:MAG TPA: osmotically inducible protein OsmC [Chloroflexi bacterium]|nr:osmotically inducible protein OsmC [Chloroflexota bacterium]
MDAKVTWKRDGLMFKATADTGGKIDLVSAMDAGAEGFRPMELLAMGLAGCTGMDVISILRKKRMDVLDFEVRVHTEKAETYPQIWTKTVLEYVVTGRGIDPAAVERAMELSRTTYCPAQNMLGKAVNIETKYTIVDVD